MESSPPTRTDAESTENEEGSSARRVWVPREAHLFLVLEGDRPAAGGARTSLAHVDEVVIGRAEERAAVGEGRSLHVGIPDPKISTLHARLLRRGDAWSVQDTGSTNGTFVDGRRVEKCLLDDGDVLRVGRTILRLRTSLPTPADTPRWVSTEEDRSLETLVPALAGEHRLAMRVAPSRVPIVLLGETGTGKEVLARAIHEASGRAGALVAVNCAALTDSLVESQLFGHVRGAFSGATHDALGFVRAADRGTLLLDEIGDLPKGAQGVLLRALQHGEIVPVGAVRPVTVDVRIIAATHQPIGQMTERGEFRRDLLARLRGFTHRLWPLRDRVEDLGLLVARILEGDPAAPDGPRARFSGDAAETLVCHEWPLNVRELVQALHRALSIGTDGIILAEHLPPELRRADGGDDGPAEQSPIEPAALSSEDAALHATLVDALGRHGGNVAAVARQLEKAPMQIYRWMQRLGVDPKRYR